MFRAKRFRGDIELNKQDKRGRSAVQLACSRYPPTYLSRCTFLACSSGAGGRLFSCSSRRELIRSVLWLMDGKDSMKQM